MQKFNINECVRFRLTAEGLLIWTAYYRALDAQVRQYFADHPDSLPPPHSDGLYEGQLWEVVNIFGGHMRNGGPVLFEDMAIYLPDNKLEAV